MDPMWRVASAMKSASAGPNRSGLVIAMPKMSFGFMAGATCHW